jgi:hypothetical protein
MPPSSAADHNSTSVGKVTGVIWVFIFAGIALAGLVMVVSYAVWLIHKAADVMSEVRVLLDRGGQLTDLIGQIQIPQFAEFADDVDSEDPFAGNYVTGVAK